MTTPQWPTEEPRLPPAHDPRHYTPITPFDQHTTPVDGHPRPYQMPPVRVPPPSPPAEQRPTHAWGFGAFLLAEIIFLLSSFFVPLIVIIPAAISDPGLINRDSPLPVPALIAALTIPPLLAAAVGLIATKIRGNGPVVDLRLRFGWRDLGIGLVCGVGGLLLTIPMAALWALWVGEENAYSAVGHLFDGMRLHPVLAVIVFLDVWLLAPICEEILYRGLLWGAMERRQWNGVLIVAVTTVAFALAHLEPLRVPLLLAIGLPMGIARLWSGRLAAPVIAHQLNNFLPALALMLMLLGVPLT